MINYDDNSEPRVSLQLADHIAVQRLVHQYADAVVHRDAAQWGRCWAEDAQWDLGRGRHVVGRPAIVQLWQTAMAGMAAVVQNVLNGDAWLAADSGDGSASSAEGGDGQRAHGRWYINERFRRANGAAGILLAHYDDDYVRSADGWLFTNRILRVHYMGAPDLSAEFMNTDEGLSARAADA
jgi:ketosteroid isomerase-like protein